MATGYCGLPFSYPPTQIDVDKRIDEESDGAISYIGNATLQPDGTWRCLANVGGALCLVEVKLRFDDSSAGPKP